MQAAFNQGILATDSKYIHCHDDDDTIDPFFYHKMLKEMEIKHLHGLMCKMTRIEEKIEGNNIRETSRSNYLDHQIGAVDFWETLAMNRLAPIAFIHTRKVLELTGLMDETMPNLGDWEFNLRFLQHYDIHILPLYLAHYRVRPGLQGSYGNTVMAEKHDHAFRNRLFRNKLLRRDLKEGKVGIGFALNMARPHLSQMEQLAKWGL
jgi:hypothetical protein